ncbi:hypothetical protein NESM_000339500 [Novymonas esmeraldas]|uniref:Nitroreductase domain-containing protein n=1 Tax=Novymonas esmeraldas TaxID=1808958 RepID=A0AAW0ELT9_9TRYP
MEQSAEGADHNPILAALGARRSVYHVNKLLPLSAEEVCTLVKAAVRAAERLSADDVPHSTRVVLLLGSAHDAFWDLVADQIHRVASPATAAVGAAKVDHSMKAAAVTLLFYSDTRVESSIAARLTRLGHDGDDMAAVMGTRGVAAAEMAVWTALACAGIGATLHHYNVLVEQLVTQQLQLPPWWRMQSQMPLGGVARPPDAKSYAPMEDRCIVVGAAGDASPSELSL